MEVIDITNFRNHRVYSKCEEIRERSKRFGCILVRDQLGSAVVEPDPFLETMQIYFKHKQVGEPSYVWKKIGRPSANTTDEELNADPIIPEGYRDWKETMDTCGNKMLATLQVVTEMVANGFCHQSHAFISKLKSLEWLTGGDILARKYNVNVKDINPELDAINEAEELGRSLWRASSTFYAYLAPNEIMEPFGHYRKWRAQMTPNIYPPIRAGGYIEQFDETNPNQMK